MALTTDRLSLRELEEDSLPFPEWVHRRVYLHPYPKKLMLRNHVLIQAAFPSGTRCATASENAKRLASPGIEWEAASFSERS
jgi:hypothetical protein